MLRALKLILSMKHFKETIFFRFLASFDRFVIERLQKISTPLARLALFIVFFWFGLLKLLQHSPANPLVTALLERTLPFITFHTFIIILGCVEMLIGILFLIPGVERVAIAILLPHMATTIMPLVFLPCITWQHPFVPTLEGQYIIKNVVIIALALGIAAHLTPLKKSWFDYFRR